MSNLTEAASSLHNLFCVRRADVVDGRIVVETRQGSDDETESDWLARIDDEAIAIDRVASSLGLYRVAGQNLGSSAQSLVYAAR
jgi:hypothetical protein